MNKNNKIIIAAIAVVALLLVIGALFASGILSGNDDDKNTTSYEVSFIDGDDVIKTLNIKENNLVSRISDPEKEGYIFTGWYSDKELTNEFDFENTLITKNTNIYAKWVKASEPEPGDITFTVTFNTDGANSIASQIVKEGEKAVKPADPLKSGYKFEGWYSDSSFTTKFDFKTPITFDITLYAKFTASQGGGGGGGSITPPPVTDTTFTVTFNSNGGSAVASQTVKEGEKATKPADPSKEENYTFAGWYSDSSFTTKFDFNSTITYDTTLYAKWAVGTYDQNGSQITITIDQEHIDDLLTSNVDVIELADTNNYENVDTVNISKDLLNNVQDKNKDNKDLSVKTAKGSVQLSSEVVDNIIRTSNDEITIKIESDSTSETKYSIEITSGGESIDKFPEAIKISIPYTLRDGENPQDIVVYYIDNNTKEHLVHGTYNEKTKCVDILTNHLSTYEIKNDAKYSINFILNGGAFSEDFDSSSYVKLKFNDYIPKPADPLKAGYKFLGWFKDRSLTTVWGFNTDTVKTLDKSDPYTINLYAKWEAVSYSISYELNEGTNSSGNPISYTIESETITFENPTKTGYTFKGWFSDAEFNNQITSIVKGSFENVTLYASWEKNKYSVTLSSGTGYSLTPLQNNIVVEHGGSFQFKLSINDNFKQSTPVVISNGETISAVNEIYTISNITENQIVTVEGIETNTYSITFANKDGFYNVDSSNPVNEGENFTFTITLDDAYNKSILTESSVKVFGKYGSVSKTGENVNQYTITNVTSDLVVLVDGLKKNEYTVKFISDGNIILEQKVSHGDSASLIENLTKPGYDFKGWYLDANRSIEYSNEAITADTTLYAKWNAGNTNYFIYIYQEKISYTSDANKYELIHVDQESDSVGKTVSADWKTYHTDAILISANGFEHNASKIEEASGVISTENPLILKLYFDRKEFTMTFKAPEGSQFFESISEIKAKYGQPVSPIRVTLPDGYTLDYWYESDEKTPYLFTTMPDHDVTLHSKFTKIYYLEYNANGGIGDLPYKIGYVNGTKVTLFGPDYPTPGSYILTKEGYTFGGWEYNGTTYKPGDSFTMPNNDVTLNAVWKPITYNVHFDGNGSTSGSMSDQTFTYDKAQDLTANAFERTGYTFAGWSKTSTGSVIFADSESVSNLTSTEGATITLYAVWQINQYTITFNSNDGSAVNPITAEYNVSVTLPTPTKEGHTFTGWYSDEELNTKYTSDKMPAENITLYANWTANSYNVTFHYNNGTDDTTDSVKFNTSITEPKNVSKLGYKLEGWYSDSNFNTKWNFASDKMPAHHMELYANWTATSYTVNFYNETELVTSTTYTVESDSIQMPSNPIKTGYAFNGWFDSTLTNEFSYVQGTTIGYLNLYAKFTINQYTITFNSNGGSEVESITDDYNASVTLPTPTKEGYMFDGWYSDESLNAKYTSDKMPAEDITLYANWTANSYILTINYVYEDGSKAQDSYVKSVVYGETYTVASPSIESFLPDIPTVTGTMPANDLTITITYGDYLISINGTNYRTIEDALASAQQGDRLILLRDYTIQKDITIPKGILLVLPCSDDDVGYDLTAEYEDNHNPDGTTKGTEKCDYLYRTLTISSNATLTVEGQLLVNAVTGRADGGYRVMDITGGYSQILLEGNIIVKNEGILEVCGYITGSGQITAESGAEVREMYIVQHWRGGSQALQIYNGDRYHKRDLFPFTEYNCHSIQSKLRIDSGASLLGNVKMYETMISGYHYTRFPQIDNSNGLIRLSNDAYLVKTYNEETTNGSLSTDLGRTTIQIFGGATFSHSTLWIVEQNLSTKDYLYPLDGDIAFELRNGNYLIDDNFKVMTGGLLSLYENASLTINSGKKLVLYDEFEDKENVSGTRYPDRPSSLLVLHDGSALNINGSFAGIISFEESGNAKVNISDNAVIQVDTSEINGYVVNYNYRDPIIFRNLHFETKYQYTVTFETNGGSEVNPLKYFLGDYLEDLPEPVKTGFNFEGWYLDSNLTQKYNYEELTGNTILYAKWEDSKYTVSFETNRGSSVAAQEILYNNTVTKPNDPTRSGYIFEGWYSDAALTSEYNFNTLVTENITLYAKWTAVEYTISFVTNNGENLDSITYTADDASLNIQELSKTGYTFEKWCIDKELTTGFEFKQYETSGDLTLYAKWVPVVYTIKYYDGTQLNLGPSSYTIEDSIALPTATKSGYEFAGWHENSDLSGDAIFSINEGTTGNKEYYASWNESVYSITYMDGDTKIENLSPASYTTTKRTDLPTPSKEGYTFNGWYNDANLTEKVSSIPMNSIGDKIFYANFTINQYTIKFNSNDGSAVDSITANYDILVTKPADPTREGYTFAGWFKDENLTNAWNFETDTMPVNGITLYAKWIANSYSVIFNANSGEGSMESQTFTYDAAQRLTANAFTKTGYKFLGWSLNQSATEAEYTDGQEVRNLASENETTVTLYAVWQINQYTITFNSNDGSAVASITDDYNASVTLPTPTKEGHAFAGWYSDESLNTQYTSDKMPAENITLYAKWDINQYTITFDSNGGSEVDSITKDYATTISKPTDPTKIGHTFAGWFKDNETFLQEWNFETNTMPVDGITLYAKWTANSYNVKYYVDSEIILNESVDYGTSVPKPADPTKTGHIFKGWGAEIPSTMPAKDLEFHAIFEINSYTITYVIDGTTVETQTYAYGATISPYEPDKQEGKEFSGWNQTLPDTMPDHNIIVSGSFDASTFTITYYVDEIPYGTPQSIKFGETVTPIDDPTIEGYSFSGWDWNGDEDGLGTVPKKMPAEHLRVDGYFTINSYNVTFHHNNGTDDTTELIAFNTLITEPTNVSKLGYNLEGWYSDSNFNTKWNFASDKMPAQNIDLYAKWTKNSYSIKYYDGSSEIANLTPTSYDIDSGEITLQAATKTGYTFAGWYSDAGLSGNAVTSIPAQSTGDKVFYANFIANSYSVSFNANSGEGSMDDQSFTYDETKNLTVNAFTKTGYKFLGWSLNQNATEAEYPDGQEVRNFTSEDESIVTLYAVWQINQYTITFNSNDGSAVNPITANYNASVTLPTPTKEGHAFAGWYSDEKLTAEYNFTTMPAEDITLYAKWTVNSYNVTFHHNNGTDDTTELIAFNTLITEPTNVSKLGYNLEGWYSDSNFNTKWNFASDKMPAQNIDLYAKWTLLEYTITFNSNGGPGSINDMQYTVEKSITLPMPEWNGYVFDGWYENNARFEYVLGQTVGDHSLTAKWTAEKYAITYMDGDSKITAESGWPTTYTLESATTLPTSATKTGYTFAGWYSDAGLSGNAVTSIPAQSTGDKVFYAKWTPITYTVIFDANGGTGNMGNQLLTYGMSESLSENTFKKDYHSFMGWSLTADGDVRYSNSESISNLTSEEDGQVTLYAVWTPTKYKITYELDGGINSPENISEYTYEIDKIRINRPDKEGYTVSSWTIKLSDGSELYKDTAALTFTNKGEYLYVMRLGNIAFGDLHLIAHYSINQYTIIFNSNDGSAVDSITADYNTLVTQPANPTKQGYTFAGWYKDEECTDLWNFAVDPVPAQNITLHAGWTSGTNVITLPSSPVSGYEFSINSSGCDPSDVPSGSNFVFNVTFTTDIGNHVPVISHGDNVKGPDSKNGSTYQFTIPNVTTSLSVELRLSDTTALINLANTTNSSDYKLSFDGDWTLTVEISNPSTATTDIIKSISDIIGSQVPVNPNSGRTVTNFLAYLPDDDTLWENNLAEYVADIAGYKIVFKQDADAIEEAKIRYLTEIAQAVRVFRGNTDYYDEALKVNGVNYGEILSISAGLDDGFGYKYIDVGVLKTTHNDSPILILQALSSNYSTVVALVGHQDAKYGLYDLENNPVTNKVKLGKNLTQTGDVATLYGDAKMILEKFNMPISDIADPLNICFDANGNGYHGYGKYYCISSSTEIRYTDIYHLKFSNYFDNARPTLHNITVSDGITLQNFKTYNKLVDLPFNETVCSFTSTEHGENTKENIYNNEYNQLLKGELIVVSSSSGDNSKLIGLKIIDSNGKDISSTIQWYDGSNTSFVMPDEDITISPIFSE